MPSLKDLKIRINSVKSTRKITKAMQMVAAAKLRRAQEAAEAGRPYAERMTGVLSNIATSVKDSPSAPVLLAGTGQDKTHLLIVATAERGLCGGFNSSIVRLAREHIRKLQAESKTVRILCVGKKGREQLKREYGDLFLTTADGKPYSVEITGRSVGYKDAQAIADTVLGRFDAGEFDVCTLFFSRFKSVIEQNPTALRLIPAEVPEDAGGAGGNYEYEPDETAILNDLLPRNVSVQIFAGLLENAASEQGARMSAMDNATRNAGEMVDKLTLQYNRSRQAAITKELIEIISGAEAL